MMNHAPAAQVSDQLAVVRENLNARDIMYKEPYPSAESPASRNSVRNSSTFKS